MRSEQWVRAGALGPAHVGQTITVASGMWSVEGRLVSLQHDPHTEDVDLEVLTPCDACDGTEWLELTPSYPVLLHRQDIDTEENS